MNPREEEIFEIFYEEQRQKIKDVLFGYVSHELLHLKAKYEEFKVKNLIEDLREHVKKTMPTFGKQFAQEISLFQGSEKYYYWYFEQGEIIRGNWWMAYPSYLTYEKKGISRNELKKTLTKFVKDGIVARKRDIGGYYYTVTEIEDIIESIQEVPKIFYHFNFPENKNGRCVEHEPKYRNIIEECPETTRIVFVNEQKEKLKKQIEQRLLELGNKIEGTYNI